MVSIDASRTCTIGKKVHSADLIRLCSFYKIVMYDKSISFKKMSDSTRNFCLHQT